MTVADRDKDDRPTRAESAAWLAVPREARPFQGHRAGLVSRGIAAVVDYLVTVVAVAIGYAAICAGLFVLTPQEFNAPNPPLFVWFVIHEVLLGLYWAAAWSTMGRSYGAHLMGLRVVNFRGRRMTLLGALLRAGACVVFPVGLFWVVVSGANRSLQDVMLRTSVIYDWEAHPRAAPGMPPHPRTASD